MKQVRGENAHMPVVLHNVYPGYYSTGRLKLCLLQISMNNVSLNAYMHTWLGVLEPSSTLYQKCYFCMYYILVGILCYLTPAGHVSDSAAAVTVGILPAREYPAVSHRLALTT